MKYKILQLSRHLGVLEWMDNIKFGVNVCSKFLKNKRFIKQNPNFPVPPRSIAFDAYNSFDWEIYRDIGFKHAKVFADIINTHCTNNDLHVLEWGCGPGRLVRHLHTALPGKRLSVYGCDYNNESIEWCTKHFPTMTFIKNELMPPVNLAAASFDVIYNFSVLTHLSLEVQQAWISELHRLLKPGGILISTTHGDNYRHLLTSEKDLHTFNQGLPVIQGNYREGKKWYLSIHPKDYVINHLFSEFSSTQLIHVNPDSNLLQDVWVSRKHS